MTTHSSILAWEISWTEELSWLQSMGLKESDKTKRLNDHHHHHTLYFKMQETGTQHLVFFSKTFNRIDHIPPSIIFIGQQVYPVCRKQNLYCIIESVWGFPGGASAKEFVCQCRRHKRLRFNPRVRRSPGGGYGNPSSILAWRIPLTGDPGRLQSIGSQRVRHTEAT